MEANDLRVMNLIQLYRKAEDKQMTVHEIHAIYFNDEFDEWFVELEDGLCVNIKTGIMPIPLTEDWIRRLGWKYYNQKTEGDLTMDCDGKIDMDYVNGKIQIKSHYEGSDMYRPINRIKYVHQLQNAFYGLNGEELHLREIVCAEKNV